MRFQIFSPSGIVYPIYPKQILYKDVNHALKQSLFHQNYYLFLFVNRERATKSVNAFKNLILTLSGRKT